MHLILHIFKKDVRRLWWAIASTIILQIAVAYWDIAVTNIFGETQVRLDWVLLIAWSALIALALREEPLVGDRQFWISRPYRWPVLLGAKLLFAAVWVHAVSFLADAFILGARGFLPWQWLPQLLEKQLMLAAMLTLPILALAAVLENFAYLALAVIAAVAIALYSVQFIPQFDRRGLDEWRLAGVFLILGTGAVAILLLQFARRRTGPSRIVGVTALGLAELLFVFVSPVLLADLRAAVRPGSPIQLQLDPHPASQPLGNWGDDNWITLAVPLQVTGIPAGEQIAILPTAAELLTSHGERRLGIIRQDVRQPVRDELRLPAFPGNRLYWRIPRSVYESAKDEGMELKVSAVARLYQREAGVQIPVGTARTVGTARCYTDVAPDPGYNGQSAGFVRVLCESPAGFPVAPSATWTGKTGGYSMATSPTQTVSPLTRVQTSMVMSRMLVDDAVTVTLYQSKGWSKVNLDLHGLRLSDYAPKIGPR